MDLRVLGYFVTVVEERHLGRAAERLRMTQPPLTRAMQQLEGELGVVLLERTPKGVEPTTAGRVLHEEAVALLERADGLRRRVADAAGAATLVVGILADTADHIGHRLTTAFRRRHPGVVVDVREADLADPTAGLRSGRVDVALTRTPFDGAGISVREMGAEPVGVVVHDDDPLAGRDGVRMADLADRQWVRLPDGTDEEWNRYWTGSGGAGPGDTRPVARTIGECLQSVLWNRACALAPMGQPLPSGLVVVPVTDRAPSRLVVAWRHRPAPLVRSFLRVAADSNQGMSHSK